MRVHKRRLCLFTFVFSLLLSSFVVAMLANAQPTPIAQAVQASYEAYASIKVADTAGANVTQLAAQFNQALSLLRNAIKLDKTGDESKALALASEAQNSFQAITPESQRLRDAAVAKQEESSRLQILTIPIAALLIAIVTVVFFATFQRVRLKQFNELRIKLKPRS
jgi:hypothetical protein